MKSLFAIYYKGRHRWTLSLHEQDVPYIERNFSHIQVKKVKA